MSVPNTLKSASFLFKMWHSIMVCVLQMNKICCYVFALFCKTPELLNKNLYLLLILNRNVIIFKLSTSYPKRVRRTEASPACVSNFHSPGITVGYVV